MSHLRITERFKRPSFKNLSIPFLVAATRAIALAFLLCAGPEKLYAADFYGELGVGYLQVKAESASFSTPTLEGRIGYYLQPQLGIELHTMAGLKDDTSEQVTINMTHSANLLLRFETPEKEGGKLFLLGGYGQTTLDIDRSGTGQPGAENFRHGNFGGGLEFALGRTSDLFLNLKWHRYYADGGVNIDVSGLGLRLQF